MAKVHKVTMYITDFEEFDEEEIESYVRRAILQGLDDNPMIDSIESSAPFEWDDDIRINYTDAKIEDYENIMNGRVEYVRT
ncbi:hypothetical protein BJ4_141 [Bacillus phage BJ4]|nr:hypothetical protein BJ4_141 [Bacillus phage BJ4]